MLRRILDRWLGPPGHLSARVQLSPRLLEEPPSAFAVWRANKQLHRHGLTRDVLVTVAACSKCGTRDRPLRPRRITSNIREFRCTQPECKP